MLWSPVCPDKLQWHTTSEGVLHWCKLALEKCGLWRNEGWGLWTEAQPSPWMKKDFPGFNTAHFRQFPAARRQHGLKEASSDRLTLSEAPFPVLEWEKGDFRHKPGFSHFTQRPAGCELCRWRRTWRLSQALFLSFFTQLSVFVQHHRCLWGETVCYSQWFLEKDPGYKHVTFRCGETASCATRFIWSTLRPLVSVRQVSSFHRILRYWRLSKESFISWPRVEWDSFAAFYNASDFEGVTFWNGTSFCPSGMLQMVFCITCPAVISLISVLN